MDRSELIDRLINKTGISREEAESTLEKCQWDMLDAMVSLEKQGRIQGPEVSVFYTGALEGSIEGDEKALIQPVNVKKEKAYNGVFEFVCHVIDMGNNIFIALCKGERTFLRIPLTVLVLLLCFTFWVIIPLVVVALFMDFHFVVASVKVNTDGVNRVIGKVEGAVVKIKEGFKGSVKQ